MYQSFDKLSEKVAMLLTPPTSINLNAYPPLANNSTNGRRGLSYRSLYCGTFDTVPATIDRFRSESAMDWWKYHWRFDVDA